MAANQQTYANQAAQGLRLVVQLQVGEQFLDTSMINFGAFQQGYNENENTCVKTKRKCCFVC